MQNLNYFRTNLIVLWGLPDVFRHFRVRCRPWPHSSIKSILIYCILEQLQSQRLQFLSLSCPLIEEVVGDLLQEVCKESHLLECWTGAFSVSQKKGLQNGGPYRLYSNEKRNTKHQEGSQATSQKQTIQQAIIYQASRALPNTFVCAQLLSGVQLFATHQTVAYQAPLSVGFSRQEHWSGLPFPSLSHTLKSLFCLLQAK